MSSQDSLPDTPKVPVYALGTDRSENTVSNDSSIAASLPDCPLRYCCLLRAAV
jgi:hypothetical protein